MTPNKKSLFLLVTFLTLVIMGCTGAPATTQPQQPAAAITLSDCQLSAPGLSTRMAAKCGRLTVPENRDNPGGRQIDLNIAVIPAVSRSPEPDPLFFLTGGPGQAATESYLQLFYAFTRINQKRAIVLVDQRGTGKSNPLKCQADEDAGNDPEKLEPFLNACLQSLDADPAYYTTHIAMQDLDAVRQALGYDTINLYGLSYGTRAAQTYLANYPEHVRTVILDGVVPQKEALGLEVAADAQRALDMILARCESDQACATAFPAIRQEMQTILERLDASPVTVSLSHPVTGEKTEIEFTRSQMASAIRLLSYAPETAALLPLLIHTTASQQDYSFLASEYLIVAGQLSDSIANAMGFSVLCSEDVPFITPDAAEKANRGTYLGNDQTDELSRVCQTWPRGTIPAEFKTPVTADTPVLILSGDADPVTPPSNGEEVAANLPNSLHLVAPGQGHNVIIRGCLSRLSALFVDQASTTGLDVGCVDEIQPVPFFINFSGPKP